MSTPSLDMGAHPFVLGVHPTRERPGHRTLDLICGPGRVRAEVAHPAPAGHLDVRGFDHEDSPLSDFPSTLAAISASLPCSQSISAPT